MNGADGHGEQRRCEFRAAAFAGYEETVGLGGWRDAFEPAQFDDIELVEGLHAINVQDRGVSRDVVEVRPGPRKSATSFANVGSFGNGAAVFAGVEVNVADAAGCDGGVGAPTPAEAVEDAEGADEDAFEPAGDDFVVGDAVDAPDRKTSTPATTSTATRSTEPPTIRYGTRFLDPRRLRLERFRELFGRSSSS